MSGSILYIEDDPTVRTSVSTYLRRAGFEVAECGTGREGLEEYVRSEPDVVLLDLNLPDISGFDVLEHILPLGGTVIVLTGSGDIPTAVEAMQAGAENFLTKPVDMSHLHAVLTRAIEKVRLKREVQLYRDRDREGPGLDALGTSPAMRRLREQIELVARNDQTVVLLTGESGTGKGFVARLIHNLSRRCDRPFVDITVAGLSPTLLESELFGHEKGAFTDARERKPGLFEIAEEGTVFLDEVGELQANLQPKLLKVLEERTFRRVGGTQEIPVRARLIAATNRNLEADVLAGRFREDLYYRLRVFPIHLPPLRERSREDRHVLLRQLFATLSERLPEAPRDMESRAVARLLEYEWPGNVREMRNVLERALILATGEDRVRLEHLPGELRKAAGGPDRAGSPEVVTLRDLELMHIRRALATFRGNRTRTAQALGISRTTLIKKIRDYGLG